MRARHLGAGAPHRCNSDGVTLADPDSASLSVGQIIARRYRVDGAPAPGADSAVYPGTDSETDQGVRIIVVDEPTAERLSKLVGLAHPHLARLLAVAQAGDVHCLIEETVDATLLEERLRHKRRPTPVDAVRNVLRLANVVGVLHEQGVVHGEVVPRAVLLHPEDRPEPVLRRAGIRSLPAGYARPERSSDAPLTIADDAWALAALLFELLTGSPPPPTGLGADHEIPKQAVPYDSIRAVLTAYLSGRPTTRTEDLSHFQHVLARWYVDHVGDEAVPSTARPHTPPPLPHSVRPQRESRSPPAVRKSRRVIVLLLAVTGIVLGLGAAWTYSTLGQKKQKTPAPSDARVAESQAAAAIDLGEIPVTGRSNERARDQKASCVSGYVGRGALGAQWDVGWLCSEVDARAGAERLKGLVEAKSSAAGATPGQPTKLGWYWIPAYGVARTGCCADPSPLVLPAPSPGCESALDSVRDIAHRVVAAQPAADAVDRFTRAIECEIKAGRAELYGKGVGTSSGPTAEERLAFGAMLEQLAQP